MDKIVLSESGRWYKADFAADTTKECVTAQDKAEHIQPVPDGFKEVTHNEHN